MCISHLVWKDPYYPNATIQQISLTLLSTCAEKPVLMAVTLLREPQELQVMKYNLFSPLLSSVSGDLQVLQVTYSTNIMLVPFF
jgi:hypothetical protein